MWIKLRTPRTIEIHGTPKSFAQGDWVEVGGQLARLWISQGTATVAGTVLKNQELDGCGVVFIGGLASADLPKGLATMVGTCAPPIPFDRALYLDPRVKLRADLLPVGFHLLEKWDLAIPLKSYDILARDVGTEEERAAAQQEIVDLRVPFYNPGVIFARRGDAAHRFLAALDGIEGNRELALLRALWRTKPMVCALPAEWTK